MYETCFNFLKNKHNGLKQKLQHCLMKYRMHDIGMHLAIKNKYWQWW